MGVCHLDRRKISVVRVLNLCSYYSFQASLLSLSTLIMWLVFVARRYNARSDCSDWPIVGHYSPLLYGCVSQGLSITEFTNLIGWNRYWNRSRFSHLDRHLDQQCFAVKKLQNKERNLCSFSSNNIYLWKCQKAWWEKKNQIGRANFGRLSSAHRRSVCYISGRT